uniref:Uncharacterized protein n=1 Tax=Palpitomonas bilix TaxID=652834 RepID=A0A7S3DJU0_9EUKA|mmetsp:Transcript_40778/g.105807  ORF Transcript_40778/g.105807 Transcript_40778/m.105807 type:complete len:184 (+) Transcript_40778:180-731(+)
MGTVVSSRVENGLAYDPTLLGSSRSTKVEEVCNNATEAESEAKKILRRNIGEGKEKLVTTAEYETGEEELRKKGKAELILLVLTLEKDVRLQRAKFEDARVLAKGIQGRKEELEAELEGLRREFKEFRVGEIQEREIARADYEQKIETLEVQVNDLKAAKRQWEWEKETKGGIVHSGGCGLVL